MAKFIPIMGNTAKISAVPISEGQFLINTQAREISVDINDSTRLLLNPGGGGLATNMIYNLSQTLAANSNPFDAVLTLASDAVLIATVSFNNVSNANAFKVSFYEDPSYSAPVYVSNTERRVTNILNIPFLNTALENKLYVRIESDNISAVAPASVAVKIRYQTLERGN